MSFVYPAFLSALALLAVPVIIHLFNFKKYKRIYFPDISFLKEVKEKTKRQSQLKHLLILLCRMLAFTFLVFAFAQPFSGNLQSASPNKIISIYIDNSFSMQALAKNGELLDIAKEKAKDLISSSPQSTRFQILTNEFSPVSQRLFNKDEAINQVKTISAHPVSRNANEIINRQDELMRTTDAKNIQLIHISDFQKNSFTYEKQKANYPITLIPIKPLETTNVSIDSVWFMSPLHSMNGQEEFYFRIRNHNTSSAANITLQLSLNKRQKAVATLTVPAGLFVDSSFTYTNTETGLIHGQLNMNDKQVVFDDKFYFSYQIDPVIHVACINETTTAKDTLDYDVKNIFGNDANYNFTSYNKQYIDYSKFKLQQFIVLNKLKDISSGLIQELEKFIAAGGSVCVIPSTLSEIEQYNQLYQITGAPLFIGKDTNRTVSEKPDFENPFYKGVFERKPNQMDVPQIFMHYTTATSSRSLTQALLQLKNGSDLITLTKFKKGKIYIVNTSTDQKAGNLGQHALFVPILLRMAELSSVTTNPYYIIGKHEGFEIKPVAVTGDNVFSFQLSESKENFIPEFQNEGNSIRIFFNNNITTAGNYNLELNKTLVSGISINYTRNESALNYFDLSELEANLKNAGYSDYSIYDKPVNESKLEISAVDHTKKYWTICVWMVLIFLLCETLILKFWKT